MDSEEEDATEAPELQPFDPDLHIRFFLRNLSCLPTFYESQESSRLTMAYFCVVALDLLQALDQVGHCII